MNCQSCGEKLKGFKSWWYGCFKCGYPIDCSKAIIKLQEYANLERTIKILKTKSQILSSVRDK